MTKTLGTNSSAGGFLPISLASLVTALAAFFGSASAVAPAGDPDFAAGYVIGSGLGFGIVVAIVAYFLALRKLPKPGKRNGLLAMIVSMIIGAVAGSLI